MGQSTGAGQDPQEDVAQLRQQIDQTRSDLGETVEALAARADLKARAHDAATAAKQQAKEAATVAAGRAREQAGVVAHKARQRATVTATALNSRVAGVNDRVAERLPEPVRWVPPLAVLGAFAAVLAVVGAVVFARRRRQ